MAAPEEPESLEQVKMKCITSPLCLSSTHTHTLSLFTLMQLGLELKSKKKRKKKPVDMSRLDADLADLAATDNTQTTDKTGSSTVSTGPAPLATNVSIVGTFCYVHYFI